MKAEWVNAIATVATAIVALYGVLVAKRQLSGLRDTLRTDSLMAVLTIESELAVTARLKTHEFGQRRPALTSPHRCRQHHRRRQFPQTKPI